MAPLILVVKCLGELDTIFLKCKKEQAIISDQLRHLHLLEPNSEFWILTSHLFTLFNTFSDVWRIPSRIPWLLLLTLPWLLCLRRDFLQSSSVLEILSNVDVLKTSPFPSCPSFNCWRTTSRPSTAGKPDSLQASESVFFQKKSVTLGCNWAKLTPPRNSREIIEC